MIRKAQKIEEPIDGFVTVADAAKYLGVNRFRVSQFIRSNRLKATKITDRLYLVDAADLRKFATVPRPTGRPKKK